MRNRISAPLLVPALAALVGTVVLAGCSGDDGDTNETKPKPSASASPILDGEKCPAKVEITGAIDKTWEGDGLVSTKQPNTKGAVYAAQEDGTTLLVYSGDSKQGGQFVLADGDDTFASALDPEGLVGDPAGEGALVDTDSGYVGKDKTNKVHVTASFECGK